MSLVTGEITSDGAVVDLLIGVSRRREEKLRSVKLPVPSPVHVRAQIDTGSFVTGAMPFVFERLGIQPFDIIPVSTPSTRPGEPHRASLYDVSLSLVSGIDLRPFPSMHIIAAADFDVDKVQAIIGRDILAGCSFEYHGTHGTFRLAF